MKLSVYVQLIRPRHWVKNFLIFTPLFFIGGIADMNAVRTGAILFLSFSALASCVYVVNDVLDRNEDRQHPQKKHRPIASGAVSVSEAVIIAVLLLCAAIALSYSFPFQTKLILGAYVVINLFYTLLLKAVALVDIFLVSSLYLLRVFAGGTLWDIRISQWLVLCTFFLALFLISAKRRAEFCNLGGEEAATRKVMKYYNKDFLDHMLTIATTSSLVTYSLYVVTIDKPYLLYSIFFVAFGLFRYLYLVYRKDIGEAPERIIFSDPWMLGSLILWILYNGVIFNMY